ncbi:uncharacterized protein DDB_G0290685-like [Gigantopelta aegis]|uniref:uncharacterized protein DDB_G0290685-like n=1 Tax=Gigantopelta aegis TaxID=1735272 RepID=UPI001B88B20E|nr:uncharacterized protein DDB_G0290685-like [Gigantopelta aegis]
MSEFVGRMKEYRQLSIDRFDGQNLKSTAFFLSHCHKDHMTGLDSPSFIERLRSRTDVFLYCTEISKILLLAETVYRPLEKYIKVMTSEECERISVPDPASCRSTEIVVTPLPALHCPGSVMFLFEGDEGTVLYTGDFRWETNHAISINAFKTGESLKEIESMYIDTTFCVESAFHFPSRRECCVVSCNIVNDWLSRSNQHYVHITSRTTYGHEPLMNALHLSTGYKASDNINCFYLENLIYRGYFLGFFRIRFLCQLVMCENHIFMNCEAMIHVPEWKFDVYSQISELCDVFTTNPTTRIHACSPVRDRAPGSKLPCGFIPSDGSELKVRSIRPSTMFFTMGHHNISPDSLHVVGRSLHRVCYSFHSSYSEIRDIVMYLKPKRVVPSVKPPPDKDMSQVQQRLNKFLKLPHLLHFSSPHRNLGKLKQRRTSKSVSKKELTDSEDLVFDSQSPVKASKGFILKTPEKSGGEDDNAVDVTTPSKMADSQLSSSYEPSIVSGEELSLVESSEEENEEADGGDSEESLRLYVSGDEEVDEDERVSTLDFTQSSQEDSQKRTGASACSDEGGREPSQETDRLENKMNGILPEQSRLANQGGGDMSISCINTESSRGGGTDENDLESFSVKDKIQDDDHDDDKNSVTVKGKNNDENSMLDFSSKDQNCEDDDEKRLAGFATKRNNYNDDDDDENSALDFTNKDKNCGDTMENSGAPLLIKDRNQEDEKSVAGFATKENNQADDESNAVDFSGKDRNPYDQYGCDNENRVTAVSVIDSKNDDNNQNKKESRGNKDVELTSAESLEKSKDSEKAKDVISSRKEDATHESSIFDRVEEHSGKQRSIEESGVADQACVLPSGSNVSLDSTTKTALDVVSNSTVKSDIKKKSLSERTNSFDLFEEDTGEQMEESQGFDLGCLPTDTKSNDDIKTNLKAGDSEGFSQCSDGPGDGLHKRTNTTKEDLKGDFAGEDCKSSLGVVGQVESEANQTGDSSDYSKNGEHNTESKTNLDISVSSNDSLCDDQLKKNPENIQTKSVTYKPNVNLSGDVMDLSTEVRISEKTAHSPSKEKGQLSSRDPTQDEGGTIGDDAYGHSKKSKEHASNSDSTTDDQNSRLTSCPMGKSASCVSHLEQDCEEDYNDDSDVVIIDLSDSDSQEPPPKRWKESSRTESDGFIHSARASTSRNRSVLDHLEKLRTVLHNGQESDSDLTQPPSQNSCSGFYSDSDVQIISDDDEEEDYHGQNFDVHGSEHEMSTGWHNAGLCGNSRVMRSNQRFDDDEDDEDVCIDLTGDDD